tara:strand:+ start:179 stop:490 length:312 start_codon:yes stop_codon:yes gene_type:complete
MLTDIIMKPLGSTKAFNPEFGPQERLLLPFPFLLSFISLSRDLVSISRGWVVESLITGYSIVEANENSARRMRMSPLRMTFRIGAVLEELLLPVRNYIQIAPL